MNENNSDTNQSNPNMSIEMIIIFISIVSGLISITSYFIRKWRKQRRELVRNNQITLEH